MNQMVIGRQQRRNSNFSRVNRRNTSSDCVVIALSRRREYIPCSDKHGRGPFKRALDNFSCTPPRVARPKRSSRLVEGHHRKEPVVTAFLCFLGSKLGLAAMLERGKPYTGLRRGNCFRSWNNRLRLRQAPAADPHHPTQGDVQSGQAAQSKQGKDLSPKGRCRA